MQLEFNQLNNYLPMFISIEKQSPPLDRVLTFFCDDGKGHSGYVENELFINLGEHKKIVRSWIVPDDLFVLHYEAEADRC